MKSDTKRIYKHIEMAAIFLFHTHFFALSWRVRRKTFFLLLVFPSLCAHLCVFCASPERIKWKKNHKHAAKQFYRFFVSCLTRLSFSRRLAFSWDRLRIDDADDDDKKAFQRISKFDIFLETKKNLLKDIDETLLLLAIFVHDFSF